MISHTPWPCCEKLVFCVSGSFMALTYSIYKLKGPYRQYKLLANDFISYYASTRSIATYWTGGQGLVSVTPSVTPLDSKQLTTMQTLQ